MNRKGAVVVILLAAALPACPPTPPPTPPSPTPTPPLAALRIDGNRFVPALRGGIICCDDPATPDVDEGLRDGWTLASSAALDQLASGRLNVTHFRSGPYNLTGPTSFQLAADRLRAKLLQFSIQAYGPGTEILPDLRNAVLAANARGIYVEVDLVDNWALVNGWNFYRDDCAVTQGPPPERYLGWIRAVVSSTGDLAVIYNLGNEGFRCRPSPAWERGLYDAVKADLRAQNRPDRPVGSQVLLPDTRTPFDYRTLGGVFQAPPAMEIPVMLTEDEGGDHTPDEWRRIGREADANGTYVMFWRGTMSDGEWADLLRQSR